MTCSTSSKSNNVSSNNDDIYVNNGNIDLKIKPPNQESKLVEDSTKVEAESDRGQGRDKGSKRVKVKKFRPKEEADTIAAEVEGGSKKRKKK